MEWGIFASANALQTAEGKRELLAGGPDFDELLLYKVPGSATQPTPPVSGWVGARFGVPNSIIDAQYIFSDHAFVGKSNIDDDPWGYVTLRFPARAKRDITPMERFER